MRHSYCLLRVLIGWAAIAVSSSAPAFADQPYRSGPAGVLNDYLLARFGGTGAATILALAGDPSGNLYVAGVTQSPAFAENNGVPRGLSESSLLRSLDLGETWRKFGAAPADAQFVLPDPADPMVLFAGGSQSIYRSADSGATWTTVYESTVRSNSSFFIQPAIDPANHQRIAAISPSGSLLLSVNNGKTWTEGACPVQNCGRLAVDASGSGRLLAFHGSDGLFQSSDWGSTFARIALPGNANLIFSAASFDAFHPGWIYVATSAGPASDVWLTKDGGVSWIQRSSQPATMGSIQTLSSDPERPDTWYALTGRGLFRSEDGASTWISLREAFDGAFALPSHKCGSGGELVVQGRSSSFSRSSDLGATWSADRNLNFTSLATGPNCTLYGAKSFSGDAFLAKIGSHGKLLWLNMLSGAMAESVLGLKLDVHGNLILLGTTESDDFPTTKAHIGSRGGSDLFVVRFSNEGHLFSSVTFGGQGNDRPSGWDIGAQGDIYIVGGTASIDFPVTLNALDTLPNDSSAGFALRLDAGDELVYSTYLSNPEVEASRRFFSNPTAVLAKADGAALIAGNGQVAGVQWPHSVEAGYFLELDSAGSRITSYRTLGEQITQDQKLDLGPRALATDAQGNVYLAGTTARADFATTPGALNHAVSSRECWSWYQIASDEPAQQVYLMKFPADGTEPLYSAILGGRCDTRLGSFAVDSLGVATISVNTGPGFPLRLPLLAAPSTSAQSPQIYGSLVARISADGSTLLSSTYLDAEGQDVRPAVAPGPEGAAYVSASLDGNIGVMLLPAATAPALQLNRVVNAFSGDSSGITHGGIYTFEVAGLEAESYDLGLNPVEPLPTELLGVRVTFDGVPAPILRTGAGFVTAIGLRTSQINPPLPNEFTEVKVSFHGAVSNSVILPLLPLGAPAIAPLTYLAQPSASNPVDGLVFNDDGSVNDAEHPAKPGSMILAMVTGVGQAARTFVPGAIAATEATVPASPLYSNWTPRQAVVAKSLPGFLTSIFQVLLTVPESTSPGTLQKVPLSVSAYPAIHAGSPFTYQPFGTSPNGIYPNAIAVYVK